MAELKLKYGGGEFPLSSGVITFGRSTENDVSFPQDSNVSRYHAEIENRHGDLVLIDLGSSNGTTVNGIKVNGETRLKPGDEILFGGSSRVEVVSADPGPDDAGDASATFATPSAVMPTGSAMPMCSGMPSMGPAASAATAAAPAVGGGSGTLIVAGVVCGLAVVCIAAAAIFYFTRGSTCEARAAISKPESGDTISGPTDIELETENIECVSAAVFMLDGEEVARSTEQPFGAQIDPKDFPELSDGLDHSLQITLIDENGEQIPQPEAVLLAFETRAVTKPEATPAIVQTGPPLPAGKKGKEVTLLEIQEMSNRFVKQFSPNFKYNVNNRQFLQEIQKRTAEYAVEGYSQKAAQYRDVIAVAYVREQNLDAPLGFVLAMSRSKFSPDKKGAEEGLWKMSGDFVSANAYNGQCGTESLSDPSQNCAAKASALYMKAIVFGVFDGDSIFSAAAFGKSPQDAIAWKATLPAERSDVWNSIKTAAEREQVARFFAAGIVAENPQKFGLAKDRPLSELYRFAM